MTSLQDFMVSRVRVKIIELFYKNPDQIYYVREITRFIKEEINAVRRELDKMLSYGLLKSEQRGNRLYYLLNKKYLFYQELQRMVAKTTGLGLKIRKFRRKLGSLDFVMFSSNYIRNIRPKQDEIDILVIGDIVLVELKELIKEEEKRLGRELNYAVFTKEEFEFRKTRRDPFILNILYSNRVMIVGDELEFTHREVPGM